MLELLKTYGMVFLVSMVPMAELRGSIPAGIALGLDPWAVTLVSIVGNMVPVPFVILFIRHIFAFLKRHGGPLQGLVARLEAKAARKSDLFYRYKLLGLVLLVAIPLPGTGAWTGSLVAAMLDIRLKNALPFILLGVCLAAVLVLALSCGVQLLL